MIDELPGRAGATLGTTDPPRHDRLRALSQAAFLKRNLDRLVEPTLEIADRSLERIIEQGTFEFINDFSSQITVGLLFRTMGLPDRDHAEIRRKVILAVSTDKAAKGRTPEHIAAFKELSDFLTAEVAARRANPTDDLITHLAEAEIDGDRLSEREVVLTTATFVMAGVESLSSFMSMFALNLHDYPDARRRLVADPALIAPAIEESLRFNTSAQRFKRTATRDIELHGETINAGDKVVLAFGSGNRDGRKFPDPDSFDIDRRPLGTSGLRLRQAFLPRQPDGAAGHRSRDAALSRARAGLSPDRRQIAWNSSSNFRSPTALPFARGLDRAAEFVGAQSSRELIEHGIDHAGLLAIDESRSDVDIFRHDDVRRHIAPARKLVGAGAQHRAQHGLDALERPAARQCGVDLRIEPCSARARRRRRCREKTPLPRAGIARPRPRRRANGSRTRPECRLGRCRQGPSDKAPARRRAAPRRACWPFWVRLPRRAPCSFRPPADALRGSAPARPGGVAAFVLFLDAGAGQRLRDGC